MEVPKALTGMRQLLRLSLDDNPLSSEVKEVCMLNSVRDALHYAAGTDLLVHLRSFR